MELTIRNFDESLFTSFEISVLNHYDIDIKEVVTQQPDKRLSITIEYSKPETLFEIGLNTGFKAKEKQTLYVGNKKPEAYEKYIIT